MKRHQIAAAAVGTLGLVVAGGLAASAHVEPDPTEIPPGEVATVGFTLEEECPDPGTNGVLFGVPEGIAAITPVEKEGWTLSTTADGALFSRDDDADADLTFQLAFTAPDAEGIVNFPIVQQCSDGTEIRWIEIPEEGQPEPGNPVAQVNVVEGAPPATTAVPVTTAAPATSEAPPETTAAPTTTAAPETTVAETTTTAPPETTAAATTVPETTTTIAAETTAPPTSAAATEEDDNSNTGLILGLIALALVLIGAVAYVLSRRSKPGPGTGPDATDLGATGAMGATAAGTVPPSASPTQVLPVIEPTDPTVATPVTPADAPLPPIVPATEPPADLPPPPPPPPPPGAGDPEGGTDPTPTPPAN